MAVTKATYTVTATWTASQLADIFRTAFIDAGLMTEWYDSFLNTVENRILEVTYDASKTYGKTYYWFMFTTTGVFVHTALGWNATTHVPTGSQYLDYYATTTNATTNHLQLITLAAATTATLTRYTSGIDNDCTWFVIRSGATSMEFFIPSAGFGPSSFIDLDKVAFNGLLRTGILAGTSRNLIYFVHSGAHTRRTYLAANVLTTTSSSPFREEAFLQSYVVNRTGVSGFATSAFTGLNLPVADTTVQSGLAQNHYPVFTSPTATPYTAQMPADFALLGFPTTSAVSVQDTIVVSAGVEEWEILEIASSPATAGNVAALFLARVV